MKLAALLPLMLLLACSEQPEGEPAVRVELGKKNETVAAPRVQSDCREMMFEEARFTHCIADPKTHRIAVALTGPSGAPLRSLSALAETRAKSPVAFAMNGGMYDEASQPIGYYVEGGRRIAELNRAGGPGNFHLLPNGVFFGSDTEWQVRATENFYAGVSERPKFGTQSGPMMVIDGKLHPEIAENGPSRKIRNGVGVDTQGRAHFAISEEPVSFGQFARLFRDKFETPNALFLDGTVSALWNPAQGRIDATAPLGPLIVVERR